MKTSTKYILWPDAKPLEEFKVSEGCFRVTSCQVFLLENTGKTRALVRVVLGDQLQLTAMRIVDGANGLFLSYPNDPSYKGEDYRSLFYALTRELRDHIEEVAIDLYVVQKGAFKLFHDKSTETLDLERDIKGRVKANGKLLPVEDLPRILAAYWRPEDKDAQSKFLEALAKKNGIM